MIVIRLKSGMGNQMFQYAYGQQLAQNLGVEVHYDLSSLLDRSKGPDFVYRNYDLDIFKLELETTHSEWLLDLLSKLKSSSVTRYFRERVKAGRSYVKEAAFHFNPDLLTGVVDETVVEGWFQSPKYFEGIEQQIRSAFQFKSPVLDDSLDMLSDITGSQSVCLNVRRTDFVSTENLNVTDLDYFRRGVDHVAEHVEDPKFFIFSDDIAWCRKNIKLDFPSVVVDHTHKGKKFGNYMQLMKNCKHFIIPNSSFAWWAVWLSEHKDKVVVAPSLWFNDTSIDTSDLTPTSWVRL